jgi:hypothetical protein
MHTEGHNEANQHYANMPKNHPGDEHCDGWLNKLYIEAGATSTESQ